VIELESLVRDKAPLLDSGSRNSTVPAGGPSSDSHSDSRPSLEVNLRSASHLIRKGMSIALSEKDASSNASRAERFRRSTTNRNLRRSIAYAPFGRFHGYVRQSIAARTETIVRLERFRDADLKHV